MAIIRHSTFDKTVQTIAERNAIQNKVNHMTVLVRDAIADIDAGAGQALYRWDAENEFWIIVSVKSTAQTISFETEELTIVNGEVHPSNIPTDNKIWDISILQNDVILFQPRLEDLTINYTGIYGLSEYEGLSLRFTYAFGTVSQQMNFIINELEKKIDKILSNIAIDPEEQASNSIAYSIAL